VTAKTTCVPPSPPSTPKAAATRQRLILIAGELFIERGYASVSLANIAERAGLSKGAIYGHFRSKGQMLVEVIKWKLAKREHDPDFQRALASPSDATAIMVDPSMREIRLLEVDAAAAARHDRDVASGMAGLYEERDVAIRRALEGAERPEVLAFVVAALSHGVGTKEAIGLPVPDPRPWSEIVSKMIASAYPPASSSDV